MGELCLTKIRGFVKRGLTPPPGIRQAGLGWLAKHFVISKISGDYITQIKYLWPISGILINNRFRAGP
jgi:hypothetical protein